MSDQLQVDAQSEAQRKALRGRLFVAAAACLWSISGLFVTMLHADQMQGIVIASYRSLFAGASLFLCMLLQKRCRPVEAMPQSHVAEQSGAANRFDRRMIGMVVSFTAMTYFFIESMVTTNPANSVLLQYSATIWIMVGSVIWLGERLDPRNAFAALGGVFGIGVLLVGGWTSGADDRLGLIYGLVSGVAYAGVVVHLRALRRFDALRLASMNLLTAGIVLWCVMAANSPDWKAAIPSGTNLAKLAVFGIVQMALPYYLFGLGLKSIGSQEAGILTLIEPLLNPLWTYLFAGVTTPMSTIVGGAILLATLLARYTTRE